MLETKGSLEEDGAMFTRGAFTLVVASVVSAACSSSSGGNNGSADGGGGGGGGNCPAAIPAGQGPFNDNACQAMNAGDFATYSATLTQTQLSFPTVCHFYFTYSYGATDVENVSFNPGCQYDGLRSTIQQEYEQYQAADGGEVAGDVHHFQDLANLGDAAFYYYSGGDFVVVLSKGIMTILSGGLCNDPLKDDHCDDNQAEMTALVSVAGIIVSRL